MADIYIQYKEQKEKEQNAFPEKVENFKNKSFLYYYFITVFTELMLSFQLCLQQQLLVIGEKRDLITANTS